MKDVHLVELAAAQDDVVAIWQLVAAGWSHATIVHRTAGLRRLHDGVFLLSHSPPTKRQRRRAATLTTPDSNLSHASAGDDWGFRRFDGAFETITRPGTSGRRRQGNLLVMSSLVIAGDVTTHNGLRITTPERTVIDLAPHLSDRALRKAFREAIRLKLLTPLSMLETLKNHRGRRGTSKLNKLAARYTRLPIDRCRSDPEAMALELIDNARLPIPQVNVDVAGEEADLSWPDRRLIIELDGPQFHRLKDEDARKTATWRAAGWTVHRFPTDDVFDAPERFVALVATY
jgi:very-short-patch-repair endonuclease